MIHTVNELFLSRALTLKQFIESTLTPQQLFIQYNTEWAQHRTRHFHQPISLSPPCHCEGLCLFCFVLLVLHMSDWADNAKLTFWGRCANFQKRASKDDFQGTKCASCSLPVLKYSSWIKSSPWWSALSLHQLHNMCRCWRASVKREAYLALLLRSTSLVADVICTCLLLNLHQSHWKKWVDITFYGNCSCSGRLIVINKFCWGLHWNTFFQSQIFFSTFPRLTGLTVQHQMTLKEQYTVK